MKPISIKLRFRSLYLFIGLVLLLVTTLFVFSINKGAFFPINEDETVYYNAARLFYETSSLKTGDCIHEDRSAIGEYGWYGPSYHLLYGGIAKISGFSNTLFPVVHFLFFLLTLLLCWFLPLNKNKRLIFIAVYLTTYCSFSFIYTYFPVTVYLLLTMILLVVYTRSRHNPKLVYLFLVLTVLFSFIHVSMIFWVFAIVPLAENFKKAMAGFLLSGLLFLFVLVCMRFYTAPAYVKGMDVLYSKEGGIAGLLVMFKRIITVFATNVAHLFTYANISTITILLLLIFAFYRFPVTNVKTLRHKVPAGLLLFSVLCLVAFMLLYTTKPFFFEKQMAFILPALLFVIVYYKKYLRLLLSLAVLVFLPYATMKAVNAISLRKAMNQKVLKEAAYIDQLSEFKDYLKTDHTEINVLWAYNEYTVLNNMTIAVLPVSSSAGIPVLYTTNINEADASAAEKFRTFGKIRVDYILSKDSLVGKKDQLVYHNTQFYLYKN